MRNRSKNVVAARSKNICVSKTKRVESLTKQLTELKTILKRGYYIKSVVDSKSTFEKEILPKSYHQKFTKADILFIKNKIEGLKTEIFTLKMEIKEIICEMKVMSYKIVEEFREKRKKNKKEKVSNINPEVAPVESSNDGNSNEDFGSPLTLSPKTTKKKRDYEAIAA